jgi:hypothetical protein
MERTLIEALPRSEMLAAMAWNETEFPRVSELVGCLSDESSRLTMFVQCNTDFLQAPGQTVGAEVFLTHMLGSHCVRGVHSMADLKALGRKSFDTLTDEKITVRDGLVNGVPMISEQKLANGNLIVVAAPLFKPNATIGTRVPSSSSSRKPNLEDIVAVPSVSCACCGKAGPTIAHEGALYCCEDHAAEGGNLVDEKSEFLVLTDEATGAKTAFVSGLFCHVKRRHGHGHVNGQAIGGGHWFERRHRKKKARSSKRKPHDKKGVPKTYGSLSVSSDSSSSSESSASSSDHKSSSRSGAAGNSSEEEDSFDSGDEVAARMVGVSLRRFRRTKNKTPAERRLDAQRREVQAARDLEKEKRRLAREKGRRAKAETKRTRREADWEGASGSSSADEAALLSDEALMAPAPVGSIRELLAIRGLNPLHLSPKSLDPKLSFESEADQAFYRCAVKLAARL